MNSEDEETILPEEEEGGVDEALEIGSDFGEYSIIRALGRGGMGSVYEMEHRVLQTRHAVKLIHASIVSRNDSEERFRREAKAMARMRHEHIVHVDDFNQAEGRAWLRMELVEGESLGDRMKGNAGKPFSEKEARRILSEILDGLAYAHESDLVHRDLKPANILLDKAGSVKIADFGLVRFAGEQWLQSQVQLTVMESMGDPEATELMEVDSGETILDSESGKGRSKGTSTRAMMGTFAYMSPEQKRGEQVDGRSDLYAVGLMAYQMLTGLESLGMKAPSRINKALRPEWDEWVEKATEAKADDRFASAREMLAAMPMAEGDTVAGAVSSLAENKAAADGGVAGAVKSRTLKEKAAPAIAGSVNLETVAGKSDTTNGSALWIGLLIAFLLIGAGSAYWFLFRDKVDPLEVPEALEMATTTGNSVTAKPAGEAAESIKTIPQIAEKVAVETGSMQLKISNDSPAFSWADATILLDGKRLKGTEEVAGSYLLTDLKTGSGELDIRHPNYEPYIVRANINKDQTIEGTIDLKPKPANLTITVNPTEAEWELFVDGSSWGRKSDYTLPAETAFTLAIAAKGYIATQKQLVLGANGSESWDVNLESQPGPQEGKDWTVALPLNGSLVMKWIQPGSFLMGSAPDEIGREGDEGPQRQVRISNGFWLGKFEVTQDEWESVMGNNPSNFASAGKSFPVEQVNWSEAMDFCRKLTEQEEKAGRLPAGYTYTLPTEAEWEYACRAGSTTRYFSGNEESDLDKVGWYRGNADGKTHSVGGKLANVWGLHDTHGNVWEWCYDYYGVYDSSAVVDPQGVKAGPYRVYRGGSWNSLDFCRSADRYGNAPSLRANGLGFRLALAPAR